MSFHTQQPLPAITGRAQSLHRLVGGLDLALLGLLMAIPWTAVMVSEMFYFPFVTPRAYAFRLAVQALFLGCTLLIACDPRRVPRRSPVLLSYLALAAVALVADLNSDQPVHNLVGDLERMGGFATTAHLAALLVVVVTVLGTARRWRLVLGSSLVASAAAASIACLQALGAWPLEHLSGRVDGGFGNPSFLAGSLLAHVFIAAYLLAATRPPKPLAAGLVAIAGLDVGAMILTGTRSAMLGLVVGAGVLVVARIRQARHRLAMAGALVLAITVAGVGIEALARDRATGFDALDRVLATSLEDTSTRSRLLVWGIAIDGFLERPLLGWGEEGFRALFNRHYDPALWFQADQSFDRPHSAPLQWLTAAGALGLLAYLAVFASAVVSLRRAPLGRSARAALGGWLAALFVHTLFVFDDLIGGIVLVLCLGLIHTVVTTMPVIVTSRQRTIPACAAAAAAAAAAFACAVTVMLPARAERLLVVGARQLATRPAEALEHLEAAASASQVVAPHACERLLDAVAKLVARPELTVESRRRITAATRAVVEGYLDRAPADLRRRLLLARLLNHSGEADAAVGHLRIARDLAPRRSDVLIELAAAEINRGNPETAMQWAEAAYQLSPEDPRLRDAVALVALYSGRQLFADELLVRDHGTALVADERFVAARAAIGDFGAVVATVAAVPSARGALRARLTAAALREIGASAARHPEWRDAAEEAVARLRGIDS